MYMETTSTTTARLTWTRVGAGFQDATQNGRLYEVLADGRGLWTLLANDEGESMNPHGWCNAFATMRDAKSAAQTCADERAAANA